MGHNYAGMKRCSLGMCKKALVELVLPFSSSKALAENTHHIKLKDGANRGENTHCRCKLDGSPMFHALMKEDVRLLATVCV